MESIQDDSSQIPKTSHRLALNFSELTPDNIKEPLFEELEEIFINAGYEIGEANSISRVINNNSLLCRSENFTKVLDLITDDLNIGLKNENGDANMCKMSSSKGYSVAMEEGFSGNDVGNKVKVVISFKGSHISKDSISKDSDLWEYKPKTAEVSLSGSGEILPEDIMMVSFRFPISYYPENLLLQYERDRFDERKIDFIIRHYIKKDTH